MNDRSDGQTEVRELLAAHARPRHRARRLALGLLLLLLLAVAGLAYMWSGGEEGVRYETAALHRGPLTVTVTATGTLQPVTQVDVGSELSGTIASVAVDDNDRVHKGEVLAQLDTRGLQAQVIQARAGLESARAKLREAKATVLETRLKLQRCAKLAERNLCTQEDLDTARAAHVRAQAAQESAEAEVSVAQATLNLRETDLSKAAIRSPIDGIVLLRQIEPGQTVAASLQTPVLFTLAENLRQMELHVAVDEADVGEVKEGQHAVFTVDAYPERSFPAVITEVRYAPETLEGVVTYETVLAVNNDELLLRPGMTATAEITVKHLDDALLVPNAALRFTPPPPAEKAQSTTLFGRLFGHRPATRPRNARPAAAAQEVWVLRDGEPVAVPVKVGATDGQMTELLGGGLGAGTRVLVDVLSLGT